MLSVIHMKITMDDNCSHYKEHFILVVMLPPSEMKYAENRNQQK
jgi:hypothetical protein